MLKKNIKELFSHSFIYSFAWISSSAASILLLPIYTRYLTRADYGILEILEYTNAVFRLIMMAGFHTSLAKFFNDQKKLSDQKKVISTGIIFIIITGGIGCIFGSMLSKNLSFILFGNESYAYFVGLNFGILYADLLMLISTTSFVVFKRSKIYLVYSLSRLTLAIIANLYFIVVLKLGALGMVLGNLLSLAIGAIVITSHALVTNGVKFNSNILSSMLRFGLPMVPAMLGATVMHNADRFLIRYYCSLSDVGIYGLGYKFPFMLNALILQSFNFIWSGATMYEIAKQPDANYQYSKITTYFMFVFVFAQLSLCIFAKIIVKILAAPKFFSAHQVIPLVSLGLCFHAFYTFFTVGSFVKDKTWLLNLSYLPAAAFNIIGNILLLPRFGVMAAAGVSMITYLLFAVMAYFSCRKIFNISFEYKRLLLLYSFAILTYLTSSLMYFENIFLEIVKCLGFVTLFGGCLVGSRWITDDERMFVKERFFGVKKWFFVK